MSQKASPQTIATEAMALGLAVLLTVIRILFETSETLGAMGTGLSELTLDQIQNLVLLCLKRPLLYFSMLHTAAALYFPVAGLRKVSALFAPKTGDLTKGSIAKGELDD